MLQDTVLFSGTVHDNIAYATDATREEVDAAARAAAAHEFICGAARRATTPTSARRASRSPAASASGSAIARTLLRDPPVLVLDEPTTGLDAASETAVLDGLQALMRGRTTILITHSPRLARTADRIVRARRRPRDAARAARRRAAARPAARRRTSCARCSRARSATTRGSATSRSAASSTSRATPSRSTTARSSTASARDAVATRIAGVDLAGASAPRYAELARRPAARRRAARSTPSSARSSPGCRSTRGCRRWPRSRGELERRLGAAASAREPELLGYKPRARAVLRANGLVLKAYGARRQFEAALAGPARGRRRPAAAPARSRARCRSCG